MLIGIDHVILAVPDPDRAAHEIENAIGLRASGGGRHERHGTFNRLVWLGDSYLELMGVFDENLAGDSWWGRFVLGFLASQGPGCAGVVLASDDVQLDAARLREAGSSLSEPQAGQRVRADGGVVRWQAAMPREPDPDLGLAFLIEHDTSAAEWTPAERAARAVEVHPVGTPVALRRVEIPVAHMQRATMRLHRDLGLAFRPSLAGGGARDTSVGKQTLRLLRRRDQAARIGLAGGDRPLKATLFSCAWSFEPA